MLTGKQEPDYLDFLNRKTGLHLTNRQVKTITRLSDDGEILGVVGFTMLSKTVVEIIVAIKQGRRLTKSLVKVTADYAFNQIKAEKLVAYITEEKRQMMDGLCKKFGMTFKKAEMVKHLTSGETIEQVYELTRSDCKWLDTI